MVKIIPIAEIDELEHLRLDERLPAFNWGQCRAHGCDAHLVVLRDGAAVARGSVWWRETPLQGGQTLGVIGHFAALDQSSAMELLASGSGELSQHGCTLAIGPMDGNTWRRYRLVTERGIEPPFFMEPDNPDEWPSWFLAAGFTPLATYFSALNEDLSVEDERIPRTEERLERKGVRLRPLQPGRFVEELRRIYAVSRVSFQTNYLYTPMIEAEFLALYEPVKAYVKPELVLLAEDNDQPVGFIFGIPDLAQAKRGPIDTVVLKTVAVLPGRTYAGLGNVLVAHCQQAARTLGFRRVIHALMHESNNSLNLSGHYAKPFRRYALYARHL
jgi:GNAT superfamily N-acetyltransferase